jgi:methionyl-tRNA formyltransferase
MGGAGAPGTVLDAGAALHIACGSGVLAIDELQPASGRRMSVGDFMRGRRIEPGTRLE